MITGNSTSLAPWHAKLGFRPEPFVASLSSISPAGGLVPLLDVCIDRVFPRGYTELRKGRSGENWGEEEEAARAKEWERGRKRIENKLTDELEKEGVEEDELVELLREAVGRYDGAPTSAVLCKRISPALLISASSDAPFDSRGTRRDTRPARIGAEQAGDHPQTHAAASSGLLRARAGTRADFALPCRRGLAKGTRRTSDRGEVTSDSPADTRVAAAQEKYPPRQVRCFRVLRISDAREGTKASRRTAQLTVWDAETFEADFFREGQRFMVRCISRNLPAGGADARTRLAGQQHPAERQLETEGSGDRSRHSQGLSLAQDLDVLSLLASFHFLSTQSHPFEVMLVVNPSRTPHPNPHC